MAIASTTDLIEVLGAQRILPPEQLRALTHELAEQFDDPKVLARDLLRRGWLTPYQVTQLLQGREADLILGPYVVQERLGEGAMGYVYRARHRDTGQVAALKVIRKDQLADQEAERRFIREFRAAANLKHPNVVTAYEAYQVGDTDFFAMEYVKGIDLADLVAEHGPLAVAEACDAIRQAALGLQHAHEHGLVHRDIKPANLLRTLPSRDRGAAAVAVLPDGRGSEEYGLVKVLDLGLVRLPEREGDLRTVLTKTGLVYGTPDFIAPEQVENSHRVDTRADVYGLGCTLFFLLTGRAPFENDPPAMKLIKHLTEAPPPVEAFRRDVPPAVARVLRKAMAKSPRDRFQTPAELAAALDRIARGEDPLPPTPRPPLPESPKPSGVFDSDETVHYPIPSDPGFAETAVLEKPDLTVRGAGPPPQAPATARRFPWGFAIAGVLLCVIVGGLLVWFLRA